MTTTKTKTEFAFQKNKDGFTQFYWFYLWQVKAHMSHNVRKSLFGHVHPAKIHISLWILLVWSESSFGTIWLVKNVKFPHVEIEDCSDCADVQTDLRLPWVRRYIV